VKALETDESSGKCRKLLKLMKVLETDESSGKCRKL
jgi:hypothetical protein